MPAFRTRIADLHGVGKTRSVPGHPTTRDAAHSESEGAEQKEEMLSVLGNGDVAVKLWIEWSK